ncbi:MAG: hypothetical protein LBB57_03310 [Clostridiales Family XIII bacterium]|jgi:hypothetical protein|nr:hypothetical protein [Clostridiales Family XIII bacterium]
MFRKKKTAVKDAPVAAAGRAERPADAADTAGGALADAELAAVIAAAAAAYESDAGACDLVYRKLNRTTGPRTEWNLAGLREVLASRNI